MFSLHGRGGLTLESGEFVLQMMEHLQGYLSQAGSVLSWLVAERYEGKRDEGSVDGTDAAILELASRLHECSPSPDSH